jgi:hypothetical protein
VDIGIGNVPGLLMQRAEIRNCHSETMRGIVVEGFTERIFSRPKEAPL